MHTMEVALQVVRLGCMEPEVLDAALLHDTIEDTDTTASELRHVGFSKRTVDIVEAVTRREGEDYEDFIERVANSGRDAVLVKLADVSVNLGTLDQLPVGDFARLMGRYVLALARLAKARKETLP